MKPARRNLETVVERGHDRVEELLQRIEGRGMSKPADVRATLVDLMVGFVIHAHLTRLLQEEVNRLRGGRRTPRRPSRKTKG